MLKVKSMKYSKYFEMVKVRRVQDKGAKCRKQIVRDGHSSTKCPKARNVPTAIETIYKEIIFAKHLSFYFIQ